MKKDTLSSDYDLYCDFTLYFMMVSLRTYIDKKREISIIMTI